MQFAINPSFAWNDGWQIAVRAKHDYKDFFLMLYHGQAEVQNPVCEENKQLQHISTLLT